MKFSDIEKFPFASYKVDMALKYIPEWINDHLEGNVRVDMNPVYQRGYVWTEQQKIDYIEYLLKGGFSGKDIFWNCPNWMIFDENETSIIELVDGKQRIQAILDFLNSKIKVFGTYYEDFEDRLHSEPCVVFHINNLNTRREVIEWYIGFNTGGSIHTKQDLKPAYDELAKYLD